jgi:outer membrane murein-binding lipoprotein Lpp
MRIKTLRNHIAVVVASMLLAGCLIIAPFSQKAYEQATSLKVEAVATMDKATEPFSTHKQEVETLKLNVEKAYEYAKGRPKNEETTKQWAIIKDPSRNSLGGFLKRWENSRTLKKDFIEEAKGLVSDGFDTVIELESGKRKPSDGQKQ